MDKNTSLRISNSVALKMYLLVQKEYQNMFWLILITQKFKKELKGEVGLSIKLIELKSSILA